MEPALPKNGSYTLRHFDTMSHVPHFDTVSHTLMPCASLNRIAFFLLWFISSRLVHTASFLRLKAEMEIHQIKPKTSVRKAKHTRNSNLFASPGKHLFPLLQLALAQKRPPLVHHPSKHPVGAASTIFVDFLYEP